MGLQLCIDSGQMTRYAEVVLAGIHAKHLTEQLALAGFIFMRRLDSSWQ
jgi:hypothetical protein